MPPTNRSGGVKIGTISASTLSTTGNKVITGVGFKPKQVLFFLCDSSAAVNTGAYGAMNENGTMFMTTWRTTVAMHGNTTQCLGYTTSGGSLNLVATYVSMDDDGFTINVSNSNAPVGFAYIAFA